MILKEAFMQLSSPSSHERYMAAHALSKSPSTEALVALQRAKLIETDAYVLSRIVGAIIACGRGVETHPKSADDACDVDPDIMLRARAQAISWISGILLHEISSKLGLIAFTASQEIPNFDLSKTGQHIQTLQAVFNGIKQLRDATSPPSHEPFDLAKLLDDIIRSEADGDESIISSVGMRPLMVRGDRQLLFLALSNGLRNAMEAIRGDGINTVVGFEPQIIVTWDTTNAEAWVSIIDNGPGISPNHRLSLEIKKSTKSGHAGLGLAIAKQALETLNGEISLEPSSAGGAKFEIRWKS